MALRGGLPPRLRLFLEAVRIGSRTLLSLDTNPVPRDWRHVTKVDPEEGKKLPLLYPLYLQHTDALSVGGSQDVTGRNTEETFRLLAHATTPAFHEPSAARHVTEATLDRAEFTAIPEVLNGDSRSLVGTLGEGIEYVREDLAPALLCEKLPVPLGARWTDRLADFASYWLLAGSVFEAYIIQNPDSAAAREANVAEADVLAPREAKRRAMAAERHLDSEVIYVEYSGTFGGEEAVDVLDELRGAVGWSRIWYGGGIDSAERSETILDAGADAVVVGDVFHDIADEEADVCARIGEAFDRPVSRDRIGEWCDAELDIGSTNATRYLSTIPAVTDPRARAREYVATTGLAWLELRELAAEADDRGASTPDGTAGLLREWMADAAFPNDGTLRTALDGAEGDFVFEFSSAFLARELDFDEPADFPVSHLSVSR